MSTICLSMIVRNESKVIERCLNSVKPFITCWCIVDTGSTDDTKELIRKTMEGIPGELVEKPWVNFGHNRTEALELAKDKADYALVVDADDTLEAASDFKMPELAAEGYDLRIEDHEWVYYRIHLFRSDAGFKYHGVLHETAIVGDHILKQYESRNQRFAPKRLEGLIYKRIGGGARSTDPEKYRKDAAIFKKALQKEPNNSRYWFYLAHSYQDCKDWLKALSAYERRITMKNGMPEEVYISLLEIARIKHHATSAPERDVSAAYLRAYEFRPQRIEPLVELARYYRFREHYARGYLYSKAALGTRMPVGDILFLKQNYYDWEAIDEFAHNAFYIGEYDQARVANESLLKNPKLPADQKGRIEGNLGTIIEEQMANYSNGSPGPSGPTPGTWLKPQTPRDRVVP